MPNVLYDTLFAPHQQNQARYIGKTSADGLSYEQFLKLSARIAGALVSAGLEPGDRVAAQVNKSIEALALYTACVQSGCVYLPLNTAYTSREISYFIGDAEPGLLVCDGQALSALSEALAENTCQLMTLNADGSGSLMQAAADQPEAFSTVDRNGEDLAAILYTSGTTGRSKGAMLTQNNLLSNAQTLVDYWQFTSADVLLHALPIYHTHGLFVASNTIALAGASMIFQPAFKLDDVIDQLPHATTMMGVPTFYTRLLSDDRFDSDLTRHMRLFISGSAPLLAETHDAFAARTGHKILERYGMTETNMNTSNPYDGDRRAGTVGFPLPGVEIKICNPDTREELPANTIGMLQVRGPNVFRGYWRMPEKTAEELLDDGFFITGDLAKIDSHGFIHIVGRDKDLIISGGFNIYPKEIELLLDEQPGVLESAVVGVPHADFGEGVVAVLVAQENESVDTDAIAAALSATVAKFKQPKKYVIVPELPRNAMGKVQKNALREQYGDLFAS
jgi:malonyl-CoA/methylmalonyl-CoA synthetase